MAEACSPEKRGLFLNDVCFDFVQTPSEHPVTVDYASVLSFEQLVIFNQSILWLQLMFYHSVLRLNMLRPNLHLVIDSAV